MIKFHLFIEDYKKTENNNNGEQPNLKNCNKSKNGTHIIENILNQVTKVNVTDGIISNFKTEPIKSDNTQAHASSLSQSSSNVKDKSSKINRLKNFLSNISNSLNSSMSSPDTIGKADGNGNAPVKNDSLANDLNEFNPLSIEEKGESLHESAENNTNSNVYNNSVDSSKLRVDNFNWKEVRYRDRSLNASISSATSSASKLTVIYSIIINL
jgi:hypothetical protein